MNFVSKEVVHAGRISITNLLPEIGPDEVTGEIIAGLCADQKIISSKYFYNREGSLLFEEITRLEEYYPTRTEKSILRRIAPGLMKQYEGYEIIELGPGDHSKISILLGAAPGPGQSLLRYLPLDISQPALTHSAENLVKAFSRVEIEGYAVDFTSQFEIIQREQPAMICFFGSTIGNFEWEEVLELLYNISRQMKKGDVLLLGMDLVKPQALLHAAYNDSRGVTAAFNKNILNSVNDLICSNFHTDDFDHLAYFDTKKSRVEMYLVANRNQSIQSPFLTRQLAITRGETIHTENSHKYQSEHFLEIERTTGLHLRKIHKDERGWFAVTEFQKS
jgi:L-histidine N-alpha-methyltransferase